MQVPFWSEQKSISKYYTPGCGGLSIFIAPAEEKATPIGMTFVVKAANAHQVLAESKAVYTQRVQPTLDGLFPGQKTGPRHIFCHPFGRAALFESYSTKKENPSIRMGFLFCKRLFTCKYHVQPPVAKVQSPLGRHLTPELLY